MDLTIHLLARLVGCSTTTIRIYMCRAEFRNIRNHRGMYYGVTKYDIQRLKQLFNDASDKRGWKNECSR